MNERGFVTGSMRELERLKPIQAVAEGLLMPWRAAERFGISRRQVERSSRARRPAIRCRAPRQLPPGTSDIINPGCSGVPRNRVSRMQNARCQPGKTAAICSSTSKVGFHSREP